MTNSTRFNAVRSHYGRKIPKVLISLNGLRERKRWRERDRERREPLEYCGNRITFNLLTRNKKVRLVEVSLELCGY